MNNCVVKASESYKKSYKFALWSFVNFHPGLDFTFQTSATGSHENAPNYSDWHNGRKYTKLRSEMAEE